MMQESKTDFVEKQALYSIGTPVQHRKFGFRGVIFDVDPVFNNSEEWYEAIPEDIRPSKDQPFYHLFAENAEDQSPYIAYVSEQNLIPAETNDDIDHPGIEEYFQGRDNGMYVHRIMMN